MKYIIVYTEGGDDLSTEEFATRVEADAWLEDNAFKAYLLEVPDSCEPECHT